MAERNMAHTLLEQMESCGRAAEQLSKSIGRFDAAGEKLIKSVEDLNTFDRMFKEDDSIQTLLKASGDIKKMMDHFEKNLPAFKEVTESSRKEMIKYKSSLDEAFKLSAGMIAEVENLSTLAAGVKDVTDLMRSIREMDLPSQTELLKQTLAEFSEETRKNGKKIHENVLEASKLFSDMKALIGAHSDTMHEAKVAMEAIAPQISAGLIMFDDKLAENRDQVKASLEQLDSKLEAANDSLIERIEMELESTNMLIQTAMDSKIRQGLDPIQNELASIRGMIEKEREEREANEDLLVNMVRIISSESQDQIVATLKEYFDEKLENRAVVKLQKIEEDDEELEELEEDEEYEEYEEEEEEEEEEEDEEDEEEGDLTKAGSVTFTVDRSKPAKRIAELFEENDQKLPMVIMKDSWVGQYYYIIKEYKNGNIVDGAHYNNGRIETHRSVPSQANKYYLVDVEIND